MNGITKFSAYINENVESISNQIVESVIGRMGLIISDAETEQAIAMYNQLLGFFSDVLIYKDEEVVPEELVKWSKNNAAMQVAGGGKISEIVVRYGPTREIVNEMFTDLSIELELTVREAGFILKRISQILDVSLNETFFAFERLSDQYQEETRKELTKLSAPIVPIKDDIVVLPLIGFIDEVRIRHIIDNVIPRLAEMNVRHVISDFSGLVMINAQVAEAIYQIGGTLRLMGIHIVVAGLRPDLAQTIVNTGMDMSMTESYATVKQALKVLTEHEKA
ncbi:rsbT co-antagonist protein RsbR [Planococcus glaciei]|jgi:rsbT co-antagonist protein RsbR|uniref:STAS domain-containing protein n=1 Tax=Planococcus glaciei TaxID=459472 RepID=UPI0008831595|nr:STAS domain-containing protein [Planococcus glaciei]SDH98453.1 rsbT co-antagonist protein RsbR [Planococcus glaciei]